MRVTFNMVEVVRGVSALQDELEKAKESLKGVDETIKRLTGRDPTEGRLVQRRVGGRDGPGGERRQGGRDGPGGGRSLFAAARRGLTDNRDGPTAPTGIRRRVGGGPGGVMGRLGPMVSPRIQGGMKRRMRRDSEEEDELPTKHALSSSVIMTPKDVRSRTESIEEQNKDVKAQTRNRRMFGLLLGTLQRFKDDSKDSVDKTKQRQNIEKKLEDREKEEKLEAKRERLTLYNERRSQQGKLRRLQQEMELVEMHKDWERQTSDLKYFIRTKAKPHIFYLPKKMNSTTKKQLQKTTNLVEEMIKKKRKKLEQEIVDLTGDKEDENKATDETGNENIDDDHDEPKTAENIDTGRRDEIKEDDVKEELQRQDFEESAANIEENIDGNNEDLDNSFNLSNVGMVDASVEGVVIPGLGEPDSNVAIPGLDMSGHDDIERGEQVQQHVEDDQMVDSTTDQQYY